jgi:hypothetical protein
MKYLLPLRYLIIGVVGIIATIVCIKIYPFKSTADLITFTTTVSGLLVSFTAFIFAMKTYLSIDSVNVITQMEGNVLENENYVTSVTSLLKEYDMQDSERVANAIFVKLEKKFEKESKTAIAFAGNLQYFIDIIVFFPALFNTKNEAEKNQNINRMNKVLSLIEKRKDSLLAISTGNLILIEETVKLIKYVMKYQELIHNNDYNVASSLLEVRGPMLKNSVTQTVYYNYLGLFYNKKAIGVLTNKYQLGNDLLAIEVLQQLKLNLKKNPLNNVEYELFMIYAEEARKAFKKALENCQDDVMWHGFIKYNDARTAYFLGLIEQNEEHEWHNILNEAIIARKKLNILIDDILNHSYNSHLQEHFIYQEYLARLVKINIQIAEKQEVTNTQGEPNYLYPDYAGLKEDPLIEFPYKMEVNKINEYQELIKNYVELKRKHPSGETIKIGN